MPCLEGNDSGGGRGGRGDCRLLCLEEKDGAVSEVEVDKVLGFCGGSQSVSGSPSRSGERTSIPWVTKLPKFRPTMQCHVGPFRSSNVLLICWAMSCHTPSATRAGHFGGNVSISRFHGKARGFVDPEEHARAIPYLLDREFRHCLLSYSCRQHLYHATCAPAPARAGLPMSMASCCMSSVCRLIFQPRTTVSPRYAVSLPCRRS